jgi:hypothetical protein
MIYTQKTSPHLTLTALIFSLTSTLLLGAGCTIIRDDGGEGGAEGGAVIIGGGGIGGGLGGAEGGGGGGDLPLSPVNVDVLALVPLDQSLVSDYYGGLITDTIASLALSQVITNKVAIAPMYRRVNEEAPLLYGLGDEESEFGSYQEAMDFFTSEEGLALLDDDDERHDGANLTSLGARLGRTAIYHPNTPAAEGRYYYEEPRDGLIVIWVNPFKRRCSLSECTSEVGDLAELLTARDGVGGAAWLSMGANKTLPASRVFHLFISTEETDDEEGFFDSCASQTGFPSRVLDHIEPSRTPLYTQLQERLDVADIPSDALDFCEALSVEAPVQQTIAATRIRAALTR